MGEDVAVALIHHFVGVMVGVVDMGVVFMPSADTVSLRRAALPKRGKSRQVNRITEADITNIFRLRGSLRKLAGLPRKLARCCFIIEILHPTSPGSPLRVSINSVTERRAFACPDAFRGSDEVIPSCQEIGVVV